MTATPSKLLAYAGLYLFFVLITFGFIQREKCTTGGGGTLKSAIWALIWPVYWLVVCGPKATLYHFSKFLSQNVGLWAFYFLGIVASFAVFVYLGWDDNLLFSQGLWILLKSFLKSLAWPVFLFV